MIKKNINNIDKISKSKLKGINKEAFERVERIFEDGGIWVNDPVLLKNAPVQMGKILINADEYLKDLLDNYIEEVIGDSPIEEVLFAAIDLGSRFGQQEFELATFRTDLQPDHKAELLDALSFSAGKYRKSPAVIFPQVKILDWPVDFVFSVYSSYSDHKWHNLIIECDGHDFHERTKEQAAKDRSRDRRLQDVGHQVFRFTGHEIWKDPVSCAQQVFDWANNIIWGR